MNKIFLFLLFAMALPGSHLLAQDTLKKQYEYAILIRRSHFGIENLEIYYGDGLIEEYAKLKYFDSGKNFESNLNTLAEAFNHLGKQGYELIIGEGRPVHEAAYQYIFKRKKN